MPKVVYEVTLLPADQHSVSIKSDDPLSLKDALPLAKKIQQRLSELEQPEEAKANISQSNHTEARERSQAPTCPIHSHLMSRVSGRHGEIWSCHKRTEDGSWCTYKPHHS